MSMFGGIKDELSRINEELTDHLNSVNQNTGEIQLNHDSAIELDAKINKLNEKMAQILLTLEELTKKQIDFKDEKITLKPLSNNERKIFLTLYTSEQALSYNQLSQKTSFSDSLVADFIKGMIKKGIPLVKEYINGEARVSLDTEFKELQAKENLLTIKQKKLNSFMD